MTKSKIFKRIMLSVMSITVVMCMTVTALAGEITPNGQRHPIGQQGSPGGNPPIDPPGM